MSESSADGIYCIDPAPWLERIRVVLVSPLYDGNVGATARAMHVMGLRHLYLVDPVADHLSNEARQMACNARDILEGARVVPSLAEAIGDVQVTLATTARPRTDKARRVEPLESVLPEFVRRTGGGQGAVVFGREDKGLSHEEITQCQLWTTIPTSSQARSLNLAQAVQIVTYELFKLARGDVKVPPGDFVSQRDMERLYDHFLAMLDVVEFKPLGGPDHFRNSLRRAFSSAHMEVRDVRVLHRICSQVEWFCHVRLGKPLPPEWGHGAADEGPPPSSPDPDADRG